MPQSAKLFALTPAKPECDNSSVSWEPYAAVWQLASPKVSKKRLLSTGTTFGLISVRKSFLTKLHCARACRALQPDWHGRLSAVIFCSSRQLQCRAKEGCI